MVISSESWTSSATARYRDQVTVTATAEKSARTDGKHRGRVTGRVVGAVDPPEGVDLVRRPMVAVEEVVERDLVEAELDGRPDAQAGHLVLVPGEDEGAGDADEHGEEDGLAELVDLVVADDVAGPVGLVEGAVVDHVVAVRGMPASAAGRSIEQRKNDALHPSDERDQEVDEDEVVEHESGEPVPLHLCETIVQVSTTASASPGGDRAHQGRASTRRSGPAAGSRRWQG